MTPHTRTGPGDEDRAELRGRSVRSGFAQLSAQAGQLVLMIGSGMVLARLLTPTDFGLLAMVTAVTGLADSVQHFGLPQAAIQHDDFTDRQATALFWRTLELSALGAVVMALSAPLLVRFYDEPRIAGIVVVFAGAFAIRGFTAVHEVVLMRRLRFGGLAMANLTAWLVAVAVGIGLAWTGAGYWALVIQALVFALVRTGAIWWRVRWRPGPRPRLRGDRTIDAHFRYGTDLTAFRVLGYAGRNVDRVVVGLVQGAQSLGFYDAAYRWARYPVRQVAEPLSNVALASLARVRHDPDAYRRSCRSGLLPIFSLIVPALIFFTLEAERTIFLLLGDQWGPSIPLFRILCVSGVAYAVTQVTKWLFMVEGRTAQQLRWGLAYFPAMALATLAGVPWGTTGVALGFTAGTWLMMPTGVWAALRESSFRPLDLYAVAARPALAGVAAAAVTAGLDVLWPGAVLGVAGAVTLARQGVVFTLALLVAWLAIPGGRERLRELVALLSSALPRRGAAPDGPDPD